MSGDVCPVELRHQKQRAAVSNGSRLLRGDQRSPSARRYRDLVELFAAEAGGFQHLPESGKQTVRRLASVSASLEDLESASICGERVDPVALCRLIGNQRRLLRDLQRYADQAKPSRAPTLEEIARARQAAA